MSQKEQQAKTKAELRNPLSKLHKVLPLSSFSCCVSACPFSSNNQRPKPLCIPCQQVRVYCCTLYYSASPFFFSFPPFPLLAPAGINQANKNRENTVIDLVVKARRCSGEQPRDSLLFCSSQSPLRVSASLSPLGRVSVCLCAQGFDTAIQALRLPWCRPPYMAIGVKEQREWAVQGSTHTHLHRKDVEDLSPQRCREHDPQASKIHPDNTRLHRSPTTNTSKARLPPALCLLEAIRRCI